MVPGVVSGRQVRALLAILLVLGSAALVAPVASGHGSGGGGGDDDDHSFAIFSMSNFRFTPGSHTVNAGTHVQWKNLDDVVHSIVSDDGEVTSGDVQPGESWEWVPGEASTVTFRCKYHSSMTGMLTVEPAEPPNTPPEVKILSPADGAELSGYVTIKGTSDDKDGDWLKVYLRVDGGKWRQVETSTLDWEMGWNTKLLKDGEHVLEAAAWDEHGEYSPIDRVTVWVTNEDEDDAGKPGVFITHPVQKSRVNGDVRVKGLSGDGTGGAPNVENESDWTVRVRWDKEDWVDIPGAREWSLTLNSRNLSNGPHTIQAVTVLNGVTSETFAVQVFVYNDAADPVRVQFTQPLERERVNGTLNVRGTAYDPESQPMHVLVRVDNGEWQRASGTNPWTLPVDTAHLSNGPHVLEAMARTTTRSSAIAKVTIFTDNGDRVKRPVVEITSPDENSQLAGTILVRGVAENPNDRPFTVQFRVDAGPWEAVSGTSRWAFTLDTTELANGVHHLQARAFDDQSYSEEFEHRILVANAPKPVDTSDLDGGSDLAPLVPSTGTQSRDETDTEDEKGIPGPGLALTFAALGAAALTRSRRVRGPER